MMMIRPGPFTFQKRPSVKTTPRSYSRKIRRLENTSKASSSTTTPKLISQSMAASFTTYSTKLFMRRHSFRFNVQQQSFHSYNPDSLSALQRLLAADAPGFTVHPRPSFLAAEVFQHFAGISDQFLPAAYHRPVPCLQRHARYKENKQGTGEGNRHDD